MKRLGIFVFYDKQGIVDRYVEYLLENLKGHLSRLLIVCNGALTADGRDILRRFTEEIYVRENTGFDAMAFKLAMTSYLGWEEVEQFDEVLLFNDTFYGPVYPFAEMFDAMEHESCDFWGITRERQFKDYLFGTDTVTPTHIHTYFCVYRKRAVTNDAFKKYWDEFDSTEWFFSDVCRHEMTFTEVLEQGGLTWKTYVELPDYHEKNMLDASVNPYYSLAYDIIKNNRCPILKRKNFVIKNLSWRTGTGGEDTEKALRYIAEHTDYDVDLIWGNILRLYNIYEIKNALHLDYILPWEHEASMPDDLWGRLAIIMYVPQEDRLWDMEEYLKRIPEHVFLCVCTSREVWNNCVKKAVSDYEYICLLALHELVPEEPVTNVKSDNYNLLENMLKSGGYISGVIGLFEKNPRLGILAAPNAVHGNHLGELHDLWGGFFEKVSGIAEKYDLDANIASDLPCICSELAMWCRADALRPLIREMITSDERVLARLCPYIAQSNGYYTGSVMNTGFASLQETNLTYDLTGIVQKCYKEHVFTDYKSLFEADVEAVLAGYEHVVIYGAGANGIKTSNLFRRKGIALQGFMVSDDQPKQAEKNGLPIYRLSEFPFEKEGTMVVVSVAYARSRNAIVKNLRDGGFKHYFLL